MSNNQIDPSAIKSFDVQLDANHFQDKRIEKLLNTGIYVGYNTNDEQANAIATTIDFGFVAQAGNEIQTGKKLSSAFEESITLMDLDAGKQLTVTSAFFVTKEMLSNLEIKQGADIRKLCQFAAECYQKNPTVVDEMQQGDFHAFEEFRKKEFDGRPMIIINHTPPKTQPGE